MESSSLHDRRPRDFHTRQTSIMPPSSSTMTTTTSSLLAPLSAHSSLKRARLLFDCDCIGSDSNNNNNGKDNDKKKTKKTTGGDDENSTTPEGLAAAIQAFVPPLYDRNATFQKLNIERKIRLLYPGEIEKLAFHHAATATGDGHDMNDGDDADDTAIDENGGKKTKVASSLSVTFRAVQQLKQEALHKLRSGTTSESASSIAVGSSHHNEGRLVIHREQDLSTKIAGTVAASSTSSMVLSSPTGGIHAGTKIPPGMNGVSGGILVNRQGSSSTFETTIPTPTWHAPWKLSAVLSSHLGWVRSVAFDPANTFFATGGADRVVKIFNLAKACTASPDALMITLTGHISPVRGLAFSERHPYLFSAGEDKLIKCWDLETNQVIRHYHGHLSGIFALKLHPTLDILVTGGRDAVARVWDMRSKHQVHCLSGHDNTVGAILTKGTDPQVSEKVKNL